MKASRLWRTGVTVVLLVAASPAMAMDIETVPVGNPGNAGELSGSGAGGYGPDRICGAVDYVYSIGKFEVTAGQYCEFLNAVAATDTYGLYNYMMEYDDRGCQIQRSGTSGSYAYSVDANWADRPVNVVSWGDAARFCNWLHNGQPTGDQGPTTTEDGSYYVNGAIYTEELMTVAREPDATWVIPTEDEWYKAAYHKNDGVTGNYFDFPTSSDIAPGYVDYIGNLSGTGTPFTEGGTDPGNYATYDPDLGLEAIGPPYYRTQVGEWENSASPYGTFDQGGNVWEWNEAVLSADYRGARAGSYVSGEYYYLHAALRIEYINAQSGNSALGFRVAYVSQPVTLTTNYVNEPWGEVAMDPEPTSSNPPDYDYPRNTAVELTAVPVEGKTFTHWEILDPNYPGDANYAVVDSNNPITIVMMDDREVTAAFKCGSGMLPLLPALGVLGVVCLRRRR